MVTDAVLEAVQPSGDVPTMVYVICCVVVPLFETVCAMLLPLPLLAPTTLGPAAAVQVNVVPGVFEESEKLVVPEPQIFGDTEAVTVK